MPNLVNLVWSAVSIYRILLELWVRILGWLEIFFIIGLLLSLIIKLKDGAGASIQFWGTTMCKKSQILAILPGQKFLLSVKDIRVVGSNLGLPRDIFQNRPAA